MTDLHDRRAGDDRLRRIEEAVTTLTGEVGKIRTRLGDRNTTLIFDLDQRYITRDEVRREYIPRADLDQRFMPRDELRKEFVPREEHEQNRRWGKQLRNNTAMVIFAAAGWLTGVIELVTHAH